MSAAAVDGWDFKQYVLGTLFYRFISENFASYIEGGDDSINYAELPDDVITARHQRRCHQNQGLLHLPQPAVCQCRRKRQHQ